MYFVYDPKKKNGPRCPAAEKQPSGVRSGQVFCANQLEDATLTLSMRPNNRAPMMQVFESDDLLPLLLQHVAGSQTTGTTSKKLVGTVCKRWRTVVDHYFVGPHVWQTDPFESDACRRTMFNTLENIRRTVCFPAYGKLKRLMDATFTVPGYAGERQPTINLIAFYATRLAAVPCRKPHRAHSLRGWEFIKVTALAIRRGFARSIYVQRQANPVLFDSKICCLPSWYKGTRGDLLQLVLRKRPLTVVQANNLWKPLVAG